MMFRAGHLLIVVVGVACFLSALTACTFMPKRNAGQAPTREAPQKTVVADPREEAREKQEQRQRVIDALLAQAEEAVADNRLTLPLHDNAYDRFAAVRLLDPDNPRARAGLESILLSYAELVRAALRKGRLGDARQLFDRARDFYAGNPLLKDLEDSIQQAEAQARQQMQRMQQLSVDSDEIELPPGELARGSPELVNFLGGVAERLRETGESVLIMARTDAEGRWIYKQMNDAVPGYRIRGDIRLSASPKLRLLPPL